MRQSTDERDSRAGAMVRVSSRMMRVLPRLRALVATLLIFVSRPQH